MGGIMRTIVNDPTLGIVDNDPLVASAIQSLLVETCAPLRIVGTVAPAAQGLEGSGSLSTIPKVGSPVFIFTYIPMAVVALRKNVTWKHIPHSILCTADQICEKK